MIQILPLLRFVPPFAIMKASERIVLVLSVLLVTSGCFLRQESRLGRAIGMFFQLALLVGYVSYGIGAPVLWERCGFSLVVIEYVFYAGGLLVWNVLLLVRKSSFVSFVRRITRCSTASDLKQSLYESIVLLFLSLVEHLVEQGTRLIRNTTKPGCTLFDISREISRSFAPNWIVVSCAFYLLIFALLIRFHKRQLLTMTEQLKQQTLTPGDCNLIASKIHCSSREFDQLFSLMPFLWFCYGILAAPGSYAWIEYSPTLLSFITIVSRTIASFLVPIGVVLTISSRQTGVHSMLNEAEALIGRSMRFTSSDKLLMLRDTKSLRKVKFTGVVGV